ncbi:MAG: YCF48-related protein, partial [Burkholderiales bacterium]
AQAASPASGDNAAASAIPAEPILQPAVRSPHAARAGLLAGARAGQRIVAVGERGVVMLSDDGRAFRQARQVPVDVTLNSVSFVDDKQGWAVGHWGVVLATRDGGETWQLQRQSVKEDRPLFSVHFFDASHGVAVGLWSLVLVTQDGGANWKVVTPPPPEGAKKADLNLLGLFADAGGRLYAAAEKGMVLWSDDRGQNWSYADTGYKGSLWAGVALPGGSLLAGGLRGSLYRSADRGRTWSRVEQASKASITAMLPCGDGALVAGLDGLLLRSGSASAAFKPMDLPERDALTSLALAADGRPVLFSRRGVVATPPDLSCK